MSDDLWKFKLDKVTTALFEVGKNLSTAFLTFCIFLSAASILVFIETTDSQISVPLLSLRLDKWYAAQTVALLSCTVFFQMLLFYEYERLLYKKLEQILMQQEKEKRFHWYFHYPSLFFLLQSSGDAPLPIQIIGGSIMYGTLFGGLIYPLYIIYMIGSKLHYNLIWWITGITSILFQLAAIVMLLEMGGHAKIIERFERYD